MTTKVYDLSDSSRPPINVLRLINDSASGAVVAIGLGAAKLSVAISNRLSCSVGYLIIRTTIA